ncbi:MAG: ComEC/Rec2 family competence protein [Bacilli bacterium]|jgi:competence protein ComEC
MIALFLFIGVLLGLWLLKLPLAAAIVVIIISGGFAIFRHKTKGLLIFVSCLGIGCAISLFDNMTPPFQEIYEGFVISSKANYYLIKSGVFKYYVQEKENKREIGDYVRLEGHLEELSFTAYESRFDFMVYLNTKGIYYELRASKTEVLFTNPLRLNNRKDEFLNNFDETSRDTIDTLLFSRKNYEAEIIKRANAMNIIFLFSMCGVYLRLLMAFFEYFLKLKFSERTSRILTLILMSPFFLLGIEKISTHRLFLTYSGRIVNDYLLKKKGSYLTLISIIALGLLAFDFHNAYQMAFLLGFGLSILIILLRSSLRAFNRKIRRLVMGLFIFVFLVPIHLSMSYELHLLQIVFQYIALPLNAFFFFVAAFSFYTWPMIKFLAFMSTTLTNVYVLLAKIDIVLIVGEPRLIFYFLYYGLYFYLPYLLEGFRKLDAKKVAIGLATLVIVTSLPITNYTGESIHFINVGQGDAILIQSHGKNVLVDTGGSQSFDMAGEVLIPFFKKKKVYSLDYLITTHDDFDHRGAAPSLVSNFPVARTIDNASSFPLSIGRFTLSNLNMSNSSDDNDKSLVLNFSLLNKKWLLMGDASIKIEDEIIKDYPNLDIDYLKVGHHGSKTSTSESFIRKITPQEAIISVGANNYYGHPHDEVVNLLMRYDVVIRRTDIEGTISYSSSLF